MKPRVHVFQRLSAPLRPRGGSLRPPGSLRGPWGGCEVKPVNLSIVEDILVVEGVRCRRLDPTG